MRWLSTWALIILLVIGGSAFAGGLTGNIQGDIRGDIIEAPDDYLHFGTNLYWDYTPPKPIDTLVLTEPNFYIVLRGEDGMDYKFRFEAVRTEKGDDSRGRRR